MNISIKKIKFKKKMAAVVLISSFVVTAGIVPTAVAAGASDKLLAEGKAIAFSKKKGNCLACHRIEGGRMAGDIAPPILMMKMRYPNKAKLRAQIWDATKANPDTVMPPFGKHRIMSEAEIDKVTEFIYSL